MSGVRVAAFGRYSYGGEWKQCASSTRIQVHQFVASNSPALLFVDRQYDTPVTHMLQSFVGVVLLSKRPEDRSMGLANRSSHLVALPAKPGPSLWNALRTMLSCL